MRLKLRNGINPSDQHAAGQTDAGRPEDVGIDFLDKSFALCSPAPAAVHPGPSARILLPIGGSEGRAAAYWSPPQAQ
jgi:hypothetical protein